MSNKNEIDIKNYNLKVSTDYIVANGFNFQKIILTDSDVYDAKNFLPYSGIFSSDKYKGVYSGILYYCSNSLFSTANDIRITYYRFPTSNRISLIGTMDKGKFVPYRNSKEISYKEVFGAAGDFYKMNEFVDLMQEHGTGVYTVFTVIGSIMISISLCFLLCARKG